MPVVVSKFTAPGICDYTLYTQRDHGTYRARAQAQITLLQ